ncbi:hypothetical protein SAMN04488690_3142 [Stenotrophomonas indicatrix]|uniref:Uncharacterized protein n=1 Tax=Stenotrophomonas indicatrix TaxID=2045451 RepID=A0A1W1H1B8_9GAMM|nr:hypothetical protein SAMN04488690_3142 [Stenotrophomonas indicatrix]
MPDPPMFDDYLTNPITYDRLEQRFLDHFDADIYADIYAAGLRPEGFRSRTRTCSSSMARKTVKPILFFPLSTCPAATSSVSSFSKATRNTPKFTIG